MAETENLIQRRQEILNRLEELQTIENNSVMFNAVITSIREASAALKGSGEDLGEAKKGFTQLKEAHEFLEGLLGRSIEEGSEIINAAGEIEQGLDTAMNLQNQTSEALSTLADGMAALQQVMDDPENPAAIMQAFDAYFGIMIAVLKKLIGKIPGIGAFLEMYLQSIQIISGDIKKLQKAKDEQTTAMRELFGSDRYPLDLTASEQRQVEIARLEAELETVEDELITSGNLAALGKGQGEVEEIKEPWQKDFESTVGATQIVSGLNFVEVSNIYNYWLQRRGETGIAWENWRTQYQTEYGITVDSPDELNDQLVAKRDAIKTQADDLTQQVQEDPGNQTLVDQLSSLNRTLENLNKEVSNLTNEVKRGIQLQRDFELADRALAQWSTPFVALQTFIRERILNDLAAGTLKWTPGQMKRFSQSTGIQINSEDVEQRRSTGIRNFAWPLVGAGCLAVACVGFLAVFFLGSRMELNLPGLLGGSATMLVSDQAMDGNTILIDELSLTSTSCVLALNSSDEIAGLTCLEAGNYIDVGIDADPGLVTSESRLVVVENVGDKLALGTADEFAVGEQLPTQQEIDGLLSSDVQLRNLPNWLVLQNQAVIDGTFELERVRWNETVRFVFSHDGSPIAITPEFEMGDDVVAVQLEFPEQAMAQAYADGQTQSTLTYAAVPASSITLSEDRRFAIIEESLNLETLGSVDFDLATNFLVVPALLDPNQTELDLAGSFFTEPGYVGIFPIEALLEQAGLQDPEVDQSETVIAINQSFADGAAPPPVAQVEVGAGYQFVPVKFTPTSNADFWEMWELEKNANSIPPGEGRGMVIVPPNTLAIAVYSQTSDFLEGLGNDVNNIPIAAMELLRNPTCPEEGIDGLLMEIYSLSNGATQWTEFQNVTNTCDGQSECSTVYRQTNANNTSRGTWDHISGETLISGQFQSYDHTLTCYLDENGQAVAEVSGTTMFGGRELGVRGLTFLEGIILNAQRREKDANQIISELVQNFADEPERETLTVLESYGQNSPGQ